MPKVILSLLLLMGTLGAEAQEKSPGLVINELMQSNIDCVMDDRNEFPDSWVELYNNSGETVALKDYRLGIGTKSDEAYLLPPVSVQRLHSCLLRQGEDKPPYLFPSGVW